MAQLFSPPANIHFRVLIFGAVIIVCGAGWVTSEIFWSPYTTYVGVPLAQPVPFSHQHHVEGLGIDCRYCHTSVEKSAVAGIPSTETCMSCHSQLWTDAPVLAPVHASLATNTPLEWNRVHDLPDFAYFDHSIHIAKGVGCVTCHGRIDEMPLTRRVASLYMEWCLQCHRDPERYLRPRERVFDMTWQPSGDQRALGRRLAREYGLRTTRELTDCSTCHR